MTEPGEATFVSRGIPVVYDWGGPATRALEATLARSPEAYWALADHYFGSQSSFRSGGADGVLPATAAFLGAETSVDGPAVVDAVEAGEADAAVDADLSAAEDAGVSATPTLFLFRSGALQTQVRGSVSYDVLRGALGL
jgi:protein-disulfide isomerase